MMSERVRRESSLFSSLLSEMHSLSFFWLTVKKILHISSGGVHSHFLQKMHTLYYLFTYLGRPCVVFTVCVSNLCTSHKKASTVIRPFPGTKTQPCILLTRWPSSSSSSSSSARSTPPPACLRPWPGHPSGSPSGLRCHRRGPRPRRRCCPCRGRRRGPS